MDTRPIVIALDVRYPVKPVEISSRTLLNGRVASMAVDERYLYVVLDHLAGLAILRR